MSDPPPTTPADTAPDWEARSTELLCPLCKYNLRGLTAPRCPECGFAFSWNELIEAEKNKHKYLFEHAKGLGFKSFWKTYWRTSWPRRFWSDLSPAQPVRVVRLIFYWIVTSIFLIGITAGLNSRQIVGTVQTVVNDSLVSSNARNAYKARLLAYPGAVQFFMAHPEAMQKELDARCPLPWQLGFWRAEYYRWSRYGLRWSGSYRWNKTHPSPLYWAAVFIAWPWVTLICLVVFRVSMRQAKIRSVHLLRAVVYCCDSGLLFGAAFLALDLVDNTISEGWLTTPAVLVCVLITTYRLTIAFRQYLRVHLPFATVLASQIIALLIVFLLLVQIADFSRRV